MAKAHLLTVRGVERIIKGREYGWHHDGGGLYLVGSETFKTFSWTTRIYRSTITGRPRDYGHGPYALFTLQEARAESKRVRQIAARGIDPIEQRRQEREAAQVEARLRHLFKDAAEDFIATHEPGWKSDKHKAQWRTTLRSQYRVLGSRPAAEISDAEIHSALAAMWTKTPETASRTEQRIKRVIQWVKEGKPPLRTSAAKRAKHHEAIPYAELPTFMAVLREKEGVSARALEFLILTAGRTSEVINATWQEIDLERALWTVPLSRMKMGMEHVVPLSKRAVQLLKQLPRERDSEFVFVGARPGMPLSNMAMLELLRGMSGNGYTVHGFRSAFRDWAGDSTNNYAHETVEFALAHGIPNKASAAYRRYRAVLKRAALMEDWSKYCLTAPQGRKVVALHG